MTDARHEVIRGLPGLAELDDASLALSDVIAASRDLTVRAAAVMGIHTTDMTALHLLAEFGPMGTTELAERLGLRLGSTTVLVDRLERTGHVERVRDTVDRRRVVVSGTAAARDASARAWLPALREIDEVCRSLSAQERQIAVDLLTRVSAAMERGARP